MPWLSSKQYQQARLSCTGLWPLLVSCQGSSCTSCDMACVHNYVQHTGSSFFWCGWLSPWPQLQLHMRHASPPPLPVWCIAAVRLQRLWQW
jgi:hypothetical protein